MPQATILDIPAATIAALAIVAALRWAYGDGPGSGRCRPWPLAFLVVALAVFAVWRIVKAQHGGLTIFDATAGILCGLFIVSAVKAAWADGPFERMPKGRENTPLTILICAGFLLLGSLVFGFGCLGLFECETVAALPPGGTYVDVLPPGNWE